MSKNKAVMNLVSKSLSSFEKEKSTIIISIILDIVISKTFLTHHDGFLNKTFFCCVIFCSKLTSESNTRASLL